MWSSWFGWGTKKESDFCRKDFPELYGGFIDYLTDTLHARGPAYHAPPNQKQVEENGVSKLPAVDRLVAIGDLHGDFQKARRAFRLGGLIDENDRWCAGSTTAVQVGDLLDRGPNEVQVMYFLERLQEEAKKAGGALHILNGNHETMNVAGKFRYATEEGMQDFASWSFLEGMAALMKEKCGCQIKPSSLPSQPSSCTPRDTRIAAVSPGGAVAQRFFAPHPVILQIGSTVFVHGGILPHHARYGVDRINAETKAWMEGQAGPEMPAFLSGREAVVWARDYSTEDARKCNCAALEEALGLMPGAERMVVGHTIQEKGINTACDNRVFRIDVGLSEGCGNGDPEVLEVLHDKKFRSLREGREPKDLLRPEATAQTHSSDSRIWNWWTRERQRLQHYVQQNA